MNSTEEQRIFRRFTEISSVIAALSPLDFGTATAGNVITCALSQEHPALRQELVEQLRGAGVIPEPFSWNERGEGIYTLEQISEMLDVPMEVMTGDMLALAEKFRERLKIRPRTHRLQ